MFSLKYKIILKSQILIFREELCCEIFPFHRKRTGLISIHYILFLSKIQNQNKQKIRYKMSMTSETIIKSKIHGYPCIEGQVNVRKNIRFTHLPPSMCLFRIRFPLNDEQRVARCFLKGDCCKMCASV